MDVKKLFDLTGKTIIITGAAGMLGSRYSYGLSKQGANVLLAVINLLECKTSVINMCVLNSIIFWNQIAPLCC